MIGKTRRLGRGQRGAAAVEMALVSMVLILMLAAIIDVGRAFNNYITITNSAREGARYAARFPAYSVGIVAATKAEAADSGVPPDEINVSIAGLGGLAGDTIAVTAQYNFPTILGTIIGAPSLPMGSTTEMVVFGID